ncbi:CU044_5270 family protein, partial [Solirubrobacter phytolaccae]
ARRARARRGGPRRAWALVPVALGTVALTLGVALPGGKTPAVIAPEPATAATVLADLRGKAAVATAPQGRFAYQKQIAYVSHMRGSTGDGGRFVVVLPHELEQWVDADGNAVAKEVIHEDQATFPTPEDKAAYEKHGQGPPFQSDPYEIPDFKVAGLTVPQIAKLPTEPTALRAALQRGELDLLPATAQLLASPIASPELKAALFSVLKALPGAQLVPGATDPQGRKGVGVQFEDDAWRTLFLFEPDTGALLGTRSIGKKEVPGRTISDWWLVVDATRTDSAPTTVR